MRGSTQAQNHPKRGSSIKVEPIRDVRIIRKIKQWLLDDRKIRNYCLFTLGVNTAFRANELLSLTVGQVNLIERMLPTAVRATMHPKVNQIAMPKLGSCFPWNGVAINNSSSSKKLDIEVHSLTEASRRKLVLKQELNAEGIPIYYSRERG